MSGVRKRTGELTVITILVIVLADTSLSASLRYGTYYPSDPPVQGDIRIYTRQERQALQDRCPRLWQRLQRELLDPSDPSHDGSPR